MNIQTNIQLSTLTTMRIGGVANYVADVSTPEELQQVYQNAKKMKQPVFILGSGSNVICHDEGFTGVVIHIKISGMETIGEDKDTVTIKAGGGEIWDKLVEFSVQKGLSGIESLSGIPGTVGAAPVQNIGAYGQELSDTMVSLEAYDTQEDKFVTLESQDCGFSYRNSIFRDGSKGRYAIVSITLRLFRIQPKPPFYDSLQKRFDELGVTEYTSQLVRDNVLAIRSNKLPDPAKLPNSGSFFKNAIVEKWKVDDLRKEYPDMPTFPVDENRLKIPAGWLIETSELKGQVLHGIKVHDGNAVVLINESASGYADLSAAREEIISTVRDKFQIMLEQEPLEL